MTTTEQMQAAVDQIMAAVDERWAESEQRVARAMALGLQRAAQTAIIPGGPQVVYGTVIDFDQLTTATVRIDSDGTLITVTTLVSVVPDERVAVLFLPPVGALLIGVFGDNPGAGSTRVPPAVDDIFAVAGTSRFEGMIVYQDTEGTTGRLGPYELVSGVDDDFWQRLIIDADVPFLDVFPASEKLQAVGTDPSDPTIPVFYFAWGPLEANPNDAVWRIRKTQFTAAGFKHFWSSPNTAWISKETATFIEAVNE